VAQQLDIDHHVFNFTDDFDEHVVAPYVDAHRAGTTPNPCIECNRSLKFARLLDRADLLGFDAVATGHHARVERTADGHRTLRRGADRAKDQSYVVHMLGQRELGRVCFPVGSFDKAAVRQIAVDAGLRTGTKPDSQDVCFIARTGGRADFLGRRLPLRPATVVDVTGRRVGSVPAVELVTLGQRRGLGLPGGGAPRYVVDVDVDRETVVVGSEADLLVDETRVRDVTWVDQPVAGDVLVQTSAHGATASATVEAAGTDARSLTLRWRAPQRRVAPGQSVVLYDLDDEHVLGGGIAA
jgi:tRNA-specific 2-thiouridylase